MFFSRRIMQSEKGKKIVVHSVFYISAILLRWSLLYFGPLNMCQLCTNENISSRKNFTCNSSSKNPHFALCSIFFYSKVNSTDFPATSIEWVELENECLIKSQVKSNHKKIST